MLSSTDDPNLKSGAFYRGATAYPVELPENLIGAADQARYDVMEHSRNRIEAASEQAVSGESRPLTDG